MAGAVAYLIDPNLHVPEFGRRQADDDALRCGLLATERRSTRRYARRYARPYGRERRKCLGDLGRRRR